jgi:hypothetical protein
MSSGFLQAALPIAGAVAGSFIPGLGTAAGMALGSAVGGAAGGMMGGDQGAAPGQAQQVAPGVIQPSGSNMLLSGVPGGDKGAAQPQMNLPNAPGGDSAKAYRTMMALGPMLAGSEGLKDSEMQRKLADARIQDLLNRAPIMPQGGANPGGMGAYGPNVGMRYLGG